MTVENQTDKREGLGNGAGTNFTFSPMVIFEASNLEVTFTDTLGQDTLLVEGAGAGQYTVNVTSYPGTGSVTYPSTGSPMATGEKITIKRVLPLEQQTDLENQGGYFPDVLETALDKLTMQDIQQQEELDRAVKVPIGSSDDSDVIIADLLAAAAQAEVSETNAAASAASAAASETAASSSETASANSAAAALVSENNADTSETNSANSAAAAAASATDSATFALLNTTSTTSVTIATGTRVFTTVDDRAFTNGQFVKASSAADPTTQYVWGQVTNWNAGSNQLTLDVTLAVGSGSRSDWIIAGTGARGEQGIQGPAGAGLADIVDDTTPQLGGQLDAQGNSIVNTTRNIITVAGTAFTPDLSYRDAYVRCTSGSAVTATIPENSTTAFPIGTEIHIRAAGAGIVTLVGAGAVAINTAETLVLRKQGSTVTLLKTGTDEWDLFGDVEAA